MITERHMETALHYLAESDEPYAEAKMNLERAEILRKRARQRVFLTFSGTVAERHAEAECDADVSAADGDYVEAVGRYETMKAKRQRAELTIDVFRTLEASRRKGNV